MPDSSLSGSDDPAGNPSPSEPDGLANDSAKTEAVQPKENSALGTVVSSLEGPSTRKFSFVINKSTIVRRGQFVQVHTEDGSLIGRVSDVYKTNRYFMRPESVKEYESSGKPMDDIFPVSDWEYLVADVSSLGVYKNPGFGDSLFPPSPGTRVMEPEPLVLTKFFGLDPKGLHLGSIPHHDVRASINFTRLIQKHLAILAISGAGKSYLTSVLMEEILSRKPEQGQIATVVLDAHGEYSSFTRDPKFSSQVRTFPLNDIQIGVPNLSPFQLFGYMPGVSPAGQRALIKAMRSLKSSSKGFSLTDIIDYLENEDSIKTAVKEPLIIQIDELRRKGIFGPSDYPPLDELAAQGSMSIIDFSDTVDQKKKQIVASYVSGKLFNARRNGIVPPVLLIIEEAHQFVPEQAVKESALSRGILTTIAREGRKFHISLCLVSQRPIQLATTVLSQCNTHIILRVTNPYDLDHIGKSSEGVNRTVLDQISSLPVGTGLLVGEAVNYPLFIQIRQRKSRPSDKGLPLEQAAVEYQKRMAQSRKDAEDLM